MAAAAAEAEGRPEAERITEQLKELEEAWTRLQEEMAERRERLNGSSLAQQYYNDADEAEAWIGEQELYMIADEKAKVRSKTLRVMWRQKTSGTACIYMITWSGVLDLALLKVAPSTLSSV